MKFHDKGYDCEQILHNKLTTGALHYHNQA